MRSPAFLSLLFVFTVTPVLADRVFTMANGDLFTGEPVSVDASAVVFNPVAGGEASPLPLKHLSPVDVAYLAAWGPEKNPSDIVKQQVAALWKGIAGRKPDMTVIGAGKPALALIETWRLPNALPHPAYWRAKPIYISQDGLVIIGEYSKKTGESATGLFQWESGKGVREIQPADLPKEIVREPGTRGRPDSYLLGSFSTYLKTSRKGPNPSGISNTWGCSADGKSFLGGTGDDWPMAQINGLLVDLEWAARTKLLLRTSLPWYVHCPTGAKADSLPQVDYGVSMMSKASAISGDGKTIAGFGEMGAWVLHSPFGFGKSNPALTLQSTGDDWRSKNEKTANLPELAAKQPGVEKLGLEGAADMEELLSAHYPDRIPLFGPPDPIGKTKVSEALARIAAEAKPLSEVEITFTFEEKKPLAQRLLLRLRSVQDDPKYSRKADEMKSMLETQKSGKWPCPPPLEDKAELEKWVRLALPTRNFYMEFPEWGITGKGGMADVMFRLKLKAGLKKARAAVDAEVWKKWTTPG